MTDVPNPTGLSAFESLPAEIMNQVLGELLQPTGSNIREEYKPEAERSLQFVHKTALDTGLLRANKRLYAMSKSYLDMTNKWIIFDIDKVYLLLHWANLTVPMVKVDPEANYALPQGIMTVHMKLCARNSRRKYLKRLHPASLPESQLLLVPLEHFKHFLCQVRVMELSTGVRIMPGQRFEGPHYDETWNELTAAVGFHGLNIRVYVDPDSGYPAHKMKPLLEYFRMFHGPLNEVTIVGADDAQQARSIEASISVPRGDDMLTMHEVLVNVVRLVPVASRFAQNGHPELALMTNRNIQSLIHLSQQGDETPWTGWESKDWRERNLERLLICTTAFNLFIKNLSDLGHRIATYPPNQPLIIWGHFSDMIILLECGHLSIEMEGWFHLLVGLHIMFSARVIDAPEVGLERVELIRTGLEHIDDTIGTFEHLPEDDTFLFREALNMCTRLRAVDDANSVDETELIQVADNYAKEFGNLVRKEDRTVKWCVHESYISDGLRKFGIMQFMTNCSHLEPEVKERYLFIIAFDVDVEGGDYYFI
ncbi:hypothetical protein N0V83_000026 [Neocucurbitaria cava]|uniref:Uncharacterized protein n=1 Tax=Neocucurbitaria cava TaxID=798079 RepID=A0A9W8YHW2_9PLEO|nr:hypothetical protein N0V83_000026 [Neocucurbitaria cava]